MKLDDCKKHGRVKHWRSGRYYKCSACSIESNNKFRRRRKREIADRLGGCCQRCGYDKSLAALVFHHKDEKLKNPRTRSRRTGNPVTYLSKPELEKELPNLELLCANCHMEEHWDDA